MRIKVVLPAPFGPTIAVSVPGSESAFLVRDLTPMQDGNFYLPALSLPWVGRQIASRHGA